MLALCSVSSVHMIHSEMIKADHMRLMHQAMSIEARELFLDLASLADDEKKSVTRLSDESSFIQAGLGEMTSEEALLVCCIYSSQGRNVHITNEHIVVCPSRQVLREIRRDELRKKAKQKVA